MSKIIKSISDIISLYDVFILDQWGVMHDGYKGYDFAIDSVEKLIRANKKFLIIITSYQMLIIRNNRVNASK